MPERKCENWLDEFMKWTVPRSEAKEQLILWTGLFTIASVLRRRVILPKKLLGSWDVYPYLYIIFVAPPGKARKTTTANYAENLLRDLVDIRLADTAMTQEVLQKNMSEGGDSSISILSGEFANFIAPSKEKMYEFLTGVFDGKVEFSYGTIGRGRDVATKPCINLLAATTPQQIAEMPIAVIEGGFASRVIFVYETEVRHRKLFYKLDIDYYKKLRKNLREDLAHIAVDLEGDFKLADDETWEYIESWYKRTADDFPLDDYRTHGYFERKPAHALKLAMILRVAYSDDLTITIEDFKKGLKIIEATETKLPKVFHSVGRNPYTTVIDAMEAYIKEKGRVSKTTILRKFYQDAPSSVMLQDWLDGLVAMGKIKVELDKEKKIVYFV